MRNSGNERKDSSLRTFIAVELDSLIRESLRDLQNEIEAAGAALRWVVSENQHVTIRFLGATQKALIPEIEAKLTRIAGAHRPFLIGIGGVGVFPSLKNPRVVWAGVMHGAAELARLYQQVDEALSVLGFDPEEKAYIPHITLSRIKSKDKGRKVSSVLGRFKEVAIGEMLADGLSLMKSTLTPDGAIYERLFKAPLAAS